MARSHEKPIALAAIEANIGAALRQRDKAISLPLEASLDYEPGRVIWIRG
jgi:hypothetical protein